MAHYGWSVLRFPPAFVLALLVALATGGGLPAQAASIAVNTTDDELNSDGDCSLREAIRAANTNAVVDACTAGSGTDTITLPAGTYTLSIAGSGEDEALAGDLDINRDLTITGAGAATTIIDGGGLDRVFDILFGSVNFSGMTIQNGNPLGDGGGIRALAGVTLTNVTVSGNTAGGGGGGIWALAGVTLTNVTVSGNTADREGGGGIWNSRGDLTLTNVTVSGNTAGYHGGGICGLCGSEDWHLTITLTNVTITANTAAGNGGGVWSGGPDVDITLTNSTVASNAAGGDGGGLWGGADTFTLKNSIVANNTSGGDCDLTITSNGNNLDSDDTCGLTGAGDLPNTDPQLGSLADNGGPTQTHALLAGSPAIDTADNAACPTTDQRGVARPVDGDRNGTATCDIGAYEYEPPTPTPTPTATPTPTPSGTPTPVAAAAELPATGGDPSSGHSQPMLVVGLLAVGTLALAGASSVLVAVRRRR